MMGIRLYFKKKDLKKKIVVLDKQEDALLDAQIDNKSKLKKFQKRIQKAYDKRSTPTIADAIEFEMRKETGKIIENYYAAVRNAREKLEDQLEIHEDGYVETNIIPLDDKAIVILKGMRQFDRGLVRGVAKAGRELSKLFSSQARDLDMLKGQWEAVEDEVKDVTDRAKEGWEEQKWQEFLERNKEDFEVHPENNWEKVKEGPRTQEEADKDFDM